MSSGSFVLKKAADASLSNGSTLPSSQTGRKILTPNTMTVTFDAASPNNKAPPIVPKIDKTKITTNQNIPYKKVEVIENGKLPISKSHIPDSDLTNGIRLVGYKLTNESAGIVNGGVASDKQKPWTPLTSKLPPCKVCGDDASGLHYGVNTCEACKAFFRRTLKRKNLDFQCICTPEERALGTDIPRKTTCPRCRYERCTKLGMSKDAIKIGRYTIGRKRQNDQEVKLLSAEKQKEKHWLDTDSSKSVESPSSPGQVSSPEEVTSDIDKMTLQEKKPPQASSVSGKAKRMRISDDREAGLLFRSLTNSIFQILAENQSKNDQGNGTLQQNAEFSPMEQLLMKPFDPTLGKMLVEQSNNGEHKQFQFNSLASNVQASNVQASNVQFTDHQAIIQQVSPQPVQNKTIINITGTPGGNNTTSITSTITNYSAMSPSQLITPIQNDVMTTNRKGSDSDNSLSSSKSSNHSLLSTTQLDNDPNSPYASQSSGIGSMSSPGDLGNSPGYLPSPNDSAFSESQMSPIECLLMSPNCAVNMSGPQMYIQDDSALQGKLKAFEEQQIVPNGEYIGTGLDDVENLPSVYIAEDGKIDRNLLSMKENGLTEEEDCNFFNDVEAELNEDGITLDDLDLQLLEFNRFQCPLVRNGFNMTVGEKEEIISHLSQLAIKLQSKFEIMTCDEIKSRHKAYLEQFEAKQRVFGTSNLTQEEYMSFYNQTGIDIDNRQEMIIELLKYMEDSIYKLVHFAKVIPGFAECDIDDQVILVKSSRFEHDMIKFGGQKCIMSSLNVVTTPWDKEYHISELQRLMPTNLCQQKAAMSRKIANLNLSLEEGVIVRALLITCPERVRMRLKNPEKVEAIHKKLIACLLHLMDKRPKDQVITEEQLVDVVFELREFAEYDKKCIMDIFEIWPVSKNHQLVKEFVSPF